MGFPLPSGPLPPSGPPKPKAATLTLAQMSALGTTGAAPPGGSPGGMPPGSAPPPPGAPIDSGPPQMPPPMVEALGGPPAGDMPARPVVAAHASQRSVGTHGSRSPNKRMNAAHGMAK